VGDKVWDVLEQGSDKFGPFAHGYTYSAHPLCAAAALANLSVLENDNLIEHVAETGPLLRQSLADRLENHPNVGEVRGDGMLAAVEFVADREKRTRFEVGEGVGAKLSAACAARGLISRAMPHGDILGFAPPLIISADDINLVADIVLDAVNEVLPGL
jgi:L-2,4-diaminobutyrate transaminase